MRYRRVQEREDRRAALGAWIQVEMNRDTQKRLQPFALEDVVSWLGHGFQTAPEAKPAQPSADDLMQRALAFMELHGAANANGQNEGGE